MKPQITNHIFTKECRSIVFTVRNSSNVAERLCFHKHVSFFVACVAKREACVTKREACVAKREACVAKGEACVTKGEACVAKGACMVGACMVEVCAWQWGGMHGREACVAGETAIAVDGTHPTGMYSCQSCSRGQFSDVRLSLGACMQFLAMILQNNIYLWLESPEKSILVL